MQIKDEDRLIKRLAIGAITLGATSLIAAIIMCHTAVKNNPDTYNESPLYGAGVVSTALASMFIPAGAAAYPYKTKEEREQQDSTNTDDLQK